MTQIDWTKPIEAEDGTPLVLAQHGMRFGDNTNPDADGDYWVLSEDEPEETGYNTNCVPHGWSQDLGKIRNRGAEPLVGLWAAAAPRDRFTDTTHMPAKTLRDEFAMAALTGMLASDMDAEDATFARASYTFADAMMLERSKKGEAQ